MAPAVLINEVYPNEGATLTSAGHGNAKKRVCYIIHNTCILFSGSVSPEVFCVGPTLSLGVNTTASLSSGKTREHCHHVKFMTNRHSRLRAMKYTCTLKFQTCNNTDR